MSRRKGSVTHLPKSQAALELGSVIDSIEFFEIPRTEAAAQKLGLLPIEKGFKAIISEKPGQTKYLQFRKSGTQHGMLDGIIISGPDGQLSICYYDEGTGERKCYPYR